MITGIQLIAKERNEQLNKHGRTVAHDIEHNGSASLVDAAIALLTGNFGQFPGHWDDAICQKMIGKPFSDRKIIAGALIAASIDCELPQSSEFESEKVPFDEIIKPVIKWLNENGHPHMLVIVTTTDAQLVEGIKSVQTSEFIKY